jgi:hypothetical protein
MKQFRFYNNIFGWLAFLIAAITYILTAEATASLWDCGEFIATAFKLEVGHPPGAPLFMLMARVASLFAGHDVTMAARMVNYMSALASAFTILFLFWTITHIARKLVNKSNEFSKASLAIIIGSGLVGSLAYTFSDTFWFSAVEGEVYASSSLFTAVVFWAILKWENVADEKYANRWILLIAYLMGLSIGVHLLNLLAIPAIVMVYYFRKYKVNIQGALLAFTISLGILAVVMYGIIQGAVKAASWFELFFVNSLGLPFNTGVVFYILLVLAILVFGIYYSIEKRKVLLNTIVLGILMLILGYTSYATIVIRANAQTPINENKPDNVFSLLSYLNREQYGDNPLFYGHYYNAPITDWVEKTPSYAPIDGKYKETNKNYKPVYDSRFTTFFPRMYSSNRNHIQVYTDWGSIKGKPVEVIEENKSKILNVPTFGENLQFFFTYQLGHMYMRYFLWNFAGRQNDEQGSGGILKGNWLSGINFIDEARLGPQSNLPAHMKYNPSRNVYFFLPFLLGIFGLIYLFERNKRSFVVTLLLFFMTGIAIVLYLNQTPYQPRERDYAYAGSFYVFAIWIGLGVIAIHNLIKSKKGEFVRAILAVLICLVLIPGIMAKENWHDHDRSNRYATRSYAYNYLNSCAPNAILFTLGDNDTFPLWYLQEVEGIRTDVRVVNTMLLNADWYIDAMKMKAYNSDTLPISLNYKQYVAGKRDRVYLIDKIQDPIELKQAIDFVASDNPDTKKIEGYDEQFDFIPGRNFFLKIDTASVIKSGTVSAANASLIEKQMQFTIKGNNIDKSQLIILDIIANNNWKRPIYYSGCLSEATCNLDEYLQLDGFTYRLVPIKTKYTAMSNCGRINTVSMYNQVMHTFDYRSIADPDVYLDNFHIRTINIMRFRENYTHLANMLIAENKFDSAIKVLDKYIAAIPASKVPDDVNSLGLIKAYFKAGAINKGTEVLNAYFTVCSDELKYYFSFKPRFRRLIDYDIQYNMSVLSQMADLAKKHNIVIYNNIIGNFDQFNKLYNTSN